MEIVALQKFTSQSLRVDIFSSVHWGMLDMSETGAYWIYMDVLVATSGGCALRLRRVPSSIALTNWRCPLAVCHSTSQQSSFIASDDPDNVRSLGNIVNSLLFYDILWMRQSGSWFRYSSSPVLDLCLSIE